jgi:hypothetical protein
MAEDLPYVLFDDYPLNRFGRNQPDYARMKTELAGDSEIGGG